MTKAKLIKRDQVVEQRTVKPQPKTQQAVARKSVAVVSTWIETRRQQRIDPRAAFAALFAQPQEAQ